MGLGNMGTSFSPEVDFFRLLSAKEGTPGCAEQSDIQTAKKV